MPCYVKAGTPWGQPLLWAAYSMHGYCGLTTTRLHGRRHTIWTNKLGTRELGARTKDAEHLFSTPSTLLSANTRGVLMATLLLSSSWAS